MVEVWGDLKARYSIHKAWMLNVIIQVIRSVCPRRMLIFDTEKAPASLDQSELFKVFGDPPDKQYMSFQFRWLCSMLYIFFS